MLTSVHPPLDARIFEREARAAAEVGLRVTIIAPGAPRGPREGVEFRSLPAGVGRWRRPLRWPLVLWQAVRLRADIYHLHDPELLPWGLLLAAITRRPVIYDAHEFFPETITTKLWIPSPLRRPAAAIAGLIERWCAAHVAAVIAVTDELATRFRSAQPRTVVVQNFPPRRGLLTGPVEDRQPDVIYAGLMNNERGLRILLRTAQVLHAARPASWLIVVGPVEWQGLPDERALKAEDWERAGVRFLPPVPPSEVVGHLARASVGWLPMDGSVPGKRLAWPVKLGEYAAAGLPIVASDLPIQARVIRAAGNGVIVPEYTGEAHAAAIIALLDDPARARILGEAGRRYAQDHLSWATQASRLLGLYEGLAGTPFDGPS
jgi:glycosyltransferase involved in cell wall biosynthesis